MAVSTIDATKQITIQISDDLYAAIAAEAWHYDQSVEEIVISLLQDHYRPPDLSELWNVIGAAGWDDAHD